MDFDVPLLVVASLFVSTNSDSVRLPGLGVYCLGLATDLLVVASLSVSLLDNSDSGCLCDMGRDDLLLSFFFRSTFSLSRSEDGRDNSLVGIERELLKSVIISFILYDCILLRGILYPFDSPSVVGFGPSYCVLLHIMLEAKSSRWFGNLSGGT